MKTDVLLLNEDQLTQRIEIINDFIVDLEKIKRKREKEEKGKYKDLSYAIPHFNYFVKKLKKNDVFELDFLSIFHSKNIIHDCDQIINYLKNYTEGLREVLYLRKHPPEIIQFQKKKQ